MSHLAALLGAEPGGVSERAHLLLVIVVVGSFIFTVAGVRRARLRSRYSLLWLSIVCALVPLAVFPRLLDWTAERLGVAYPPALLLLLSVAVLFLFSVHLSWEVSRADDRIRRLAEELALLRADLDETRRASSFDDGGADDRN